MPSPYQIVTSGDLAIVGQDADLQRLYAAAGGFYPAPYGVAGGYPAIMGADGGMPQMTMDQVMAMQLARGSLLVQDQKPTKARRVAVPFARTNVAANTTTTIFAQPQVVFRAERLFVPSDIGGIFMIEDLKVGKDSQFGAAGGHSARIFDERSEGCNLMCDTAQISQLLAITVSNISGASAFFTASVFGPAVEM